ncbi:lipocalin-like domain-containing protein [Flavobacterium notoginsengisoli]|uniref:lipocalin family protein n=1 Tax=Flavobacterium notoginsengisoli TaxID=1478199 RepID=UPI00363DB09E
MKHSLILLLCSLVISCQKIETKNLVGIWKTKDFLDTTNNNFEDKIIFTKDNLLIIEIVSKGKVVNKETGTYELKNDTITIKFNNQYSFDFRILKLDESEMELLNIKENKVIKYIK